MNFHSFCNYRGRGDTVAGLLSLLRSFSSIDIYATRSVLRILQETTACRAAGLCAATGHQLRLSRT